jgi:hypothetical protein
VGKSEEEPEEFPAVVSNWERSIASRIRDRISVTRRQDCLVTLLQLFQEFERLVVAATLKIMRQPWVDRLR